MTSGFPVIARKAEAIHEQRSVSHKDFLDAQALDQQRIHRLRYAMVRGGFILLVVALTAPSLAAAQTISFGDGAAMLGKSCAPDIVAKRILDLPGA